MKAKCQTCTLWWCPACLLNRYGEEVAKVGHALASSPMPYRMHRACFSYQALTQPSCMESQSRLCCRMLMKGMGACVQVNDVAGWGCPRCRDICNCSNCRKVSPAF